MSDGKDLEFQRGIPKNLDINSSRNKTYIIESGAAEITYGTFPWAGPSNNNITISCPINDPSTYVGRQIRKRVSGTTTVTGVSAGAGIPLLQAAGLQTAPGVPAGNQYYFAPRCRPLRNITRNIDINFNGLSVG